jgi:hypothetical protein
MNLPHYGYSRLADSIQYRGPRDHDLHLCSSYGYWRGRESVVFVVFRVFLSDLRLEKKKACVRE